MVSQRENYIATHMWIRLGIYQSNMPVDTLGHLKATCMWIPLDISKATRMWIHLDILKHHACGYPWTSLTQHACQHAVDTLGHFYGNIHVYAHGHFPNQHASGYP